MPIPVNVVTLPKDVSALPWTGERFVPGIHGQVEMEHIHRYITTLQLCLNKDVLDIASGEGYGCYILAQVAKSVLGVDIDAASIQASNEKYASDKIQFKVGSCAAIPLEANVLDTVVSFETIEHIKEQELFVQETKRVLRKNGVFIVSTPDRVVATPLGAKPNEFHIRELYREEFYQLLKKYFKNVLFFGQRSITGSLIFPDGRRFQNESKDELFFATAHQKDSIDCLEFFPRPQNIIAIATDGDENLSFASSVYEGIFGTLDSLNSEYDHLRMLYESSQLELQKSHLELQRIASEHQKTLELSGKKYEDLFKSYENISKSYNDLLERYKKVTLSDVRQKVKAFFKKSPKDKMEVKT